MSRLLAAYAAIDNGGYKVLPSLIERIDDVSGKTLFRWGDTECAACQGGQPGYDEKAPPSLPDPRARILDPRVAYQVTHLLEGVVLRGTATAAKVLGIPLAGKTGTTNESRDTWFIGFTPDLVVGVYVGYDKPESLGKKETGGRVALPAFIDFMRGALPYYPARPFEVPPGIQFIDVERGAGTQTLPWAAGTGAPSPGTIHEAFVTGGPIFLPGKEPQSDVVDAGSVTPDIVDSTPQNPGLDLTEPSPGVPQMTPADRYAQDYYKAYQQQRMQQYQQNLNQRDAAGALAPPPQTPTTGYGTPLRPRSGSTTPIPPAATGTGALY